MHGGMGVVDEHIVSHYFKRLTMIDLTFGDADYHLGALQRDLAAYRCSGVSLTVRMAARP